MDVEKDEPKISEFILKLLLINKNDPMCSIYYGCLLYTSDAADDYLTV